MNTRPKSQGDKSPSDKSQGGKAGYFKQQPKRTIAEATGAPRREDAMLAATEPVQKQARHVLESAFESIELSFRAAGLGTVAVNRKIIDIARTNISSSFDLAMGLAGAKTPTRGGAAEYGVLRPAHEGARRPSAGAPRASGRARDDSERAAARAHKRS